jgi:heme/copper-type cytochrome/quinol oxidase subunit 2
MFLSPDPVPQGDEQPASNKAAIKKNIVTCLILNLLILTIFVWFAILTGSRAFRQQVNKNKPGIEKKKVNETGGIVLPSI